MQQNPARFVMLQFSRNPGSRGVILLLLDSNHGSPLQILIEPDWKERVDAADEAYLSELMNEWTRLPAEAISGLVDELCRQSMGPLRVTRRGEMPLPNLHELVEMPARVATPSLLPIEEWLSFRRTS